MNIDDYVGLRVTFRGLWNFHLCAPPSMGQRMYQVPQLDIWETFTLLKNPDNTYSLRTFHGNFVSQQAGNGAGIFQQSFIGPWEKFWIQPFADKWCLRSVPFGNFMTAVETRGKPGTVASTQSFCGPWEQWNLVVREEVNFVELQYQVDQAKIA